MVGGLSSGLTPLSAFIFPEDRTVRRAGMAPPGGELPAEAPALTRVGIEQIQARGINVEALREKLIDATGAEFTTYTRPGSSSC